MTVCLKRRNVTTSREYWLAHARIDDRTDRHRPLVLYSASGQHTGTANLFQAVIQIPRFTEYLEKRYERAYCADRK
jgi:hypothetical protein